MLLFDTHAHLEDEQFDGIRDNVIVRARAAGVGQMLAVGTCLASSQKCAALAGSQSDIWASVGIHPNYCSTAGGDDWERIVELAKQPRVVALGETGLDRHWDDSPFEMQQDYFARHIQLGRQTGLPFIVHMRDCETDTLNFLSNMTKDGPLRGVMHSFTGTLDGAREFLRMGLHISFAGMVTFKKSDELRYIAKAVPDDRLLIETDCPYLTPHPFRGQRPNEPSFLKHTAQCLAEVRGVSLAELAAQTTANARRLFWRIASP